MSPFLKNLSLFRSLLAFISRTNSVPTDTCTPAAPDEPILVTANCTDSGYVQVIDDETDEVSPIAHRKVAGRFNGTESRFNIYLPNERGWEGRFFQLVYPSQTENATEDAITFGAESGGYTIQINGSIDYRVDAAAAKVSREVAADFYQRHEGHIHGYIYGGSGGSLQIARALENTSGMWGEAVPIIQAIPILFMNNPAPSGPAGLVLRNKSAGLG